MPTSVPCPKDGTYNAVDNEIFSDVTSITVTATSVPRFSRIWHKDEKYTGKIPEIFLYKKIWNSAYANVTRDKVRLG